MNVLTDTWRALVRRRLWPVALLLIAALAAVPHFLAKQPAPAPAPALPAAVTSAVAAATPAATLVSATDDPQGGRRRYVLGARKDPFEPAPLPKVKKAKKKATTTATKAAPTPTPSAPPASAPPASAPPASAPPAPAPAPAPSKPTYPANSLQVNFGTVSGTLAKRTLETDKALPSEGNPVLVYTGLTGHGKVAEFMVGSNVAQLEGDGTCDTGCTTLRLKAGDTEFVTLQNGTRYELDLLKIHASAKAKATASAAKAHTARRARRPRTHF